MSATTSISRAIWGNDVPAPQSPQSDAIALPLGKEVVPLLPGINLPFLDIIYMWPALLVVLCVHEAGHAWAAWTEGVPVEGFGVFAALFFPGAYATLHHSFRRFPAASQLKIVCAGVWHNIILALVCAAILQVRGAGLASLSLSPKGVPAPQSYRCQRTRSFCLTRAPTWGCNREHRWPRDAHSRIFAQIIHALQGGQDVRVKLYIGGALPSALIVPASRIKVEFSGIEVCEFAPRKWVRYASPADAWMRAVLRAPAAIRKFLTYIMHTSFSIGLINAIPCPHFDGAEIARIASRKLGWSERVETRIIYSGLALLIASITPSMLTALIK